MNQRQYLIRGTFLLTLTGLITKIAGFYYKIFLSRTIGAEQIGLFQLSAPVFFFCLSAASGGIQMAISRFTAEYFAENKRKSAHCILGCGLLLSGALSAVCAAALCLGAPVIAGRFLLEARCAPLIRITAFSLPFAAAHACVSGYFVGRKKAALSAASQMAEQMLRMAAVFFFYALSLKNKVQMSATVMALGQVAGELSAALFCACALLLSKGTASDKRSSHDTVAAGERRSPQPDTPSPARRVLSKISSVSVQRASVRSCFGKILSMSLPLTLTRMLMCVLQGIEAAMLPQQLQRFGMDASSALTAYGTLTGMAIPLLFFPTAATGAFATLLLPVVSEAKALHQGKKITGTINASFYSSLLLGYFFFTAFLLFGRQCGEQVFHSALAGDYICSLAIICPFLYMNTTLGSILHGLGKTAVVSLGNTAGFFIRLSMLLLLVPDMGINGYFTGMLLSHAFVSACSLAALHQAGGFSADLSRAILKPGLISLAAGAFITALKLLYPGFINNSLAGLLLGAILYTALYFLLVFWLLFRREDRRRLLLSAKRLRL